MAREITPIEISDKAFLITSTIDSCPKTMIFSELRHEFNRAATLAPADQRQIEVRAKLFHKVPKLAI